MRYAKHVTDRVIPQSEPIPGEEQVLNSAGGYVYELDAWARLRRFLILGSEGNTYYATERELTRENAHVVEKLLRADGPRVVREIVEISASGRAPKNDPAVFALAMALAFGDDETKRAVVEALPAVCRIGTHLLHFVDAANELRGWGKMLRRAVAGWYDAKGVRDLALQAVKYKQRDGWSQRDLLRLAHVKPNSDLQSAVLKWIAKVDEPAEPFRGSDAEIIWAAEEARTAGKERLIELIEEYRLPRETIPTERLTDPDVWAAMLLTMGMTALIRNLANMTRCGLIGEGRSAAVDTIVSRLTDEEQLRKARIHPIQALSAMTTYGSGHGVRSNGASWVPNQSVVDALDAAFYKTFGSVEPTGRRYMLALDVSGSMAAYQIAGVPGLTPRVASAALAMLTLATEADVHTIAFTSGEGGFAPDKQAYASGVSPIALSKRRRLDDIVKAVSDLPFGGTDCALPMLYAAARGIVVDIFVVYTDSETWAGHIHPSQALRQYRAEVNPGARLIVVGMVSNGFTIADPKDRGMLDVVGFDTATPGLMSDFVLDRL